jgi:hypothetical protein
LTAKFYNLAVNCLHSELVKKSEIRQKTENSHAC